VTGDVKHQPNAGSPHLSRGRLTYEVSGDFWLNLRRSIFD